MPNFGSCFKEGVTGLGPKSLCDRPSKSKFFSVRVADVVENNFKIGFSLMMSVSYNVSFSRMKTVFI